MVTSPLSAPLNLTQNDIWEIDKIPNIGPDFEHTYHNTISFTKIEHAWLNTTIKKYILFKLVNGFSYGTISNTINYMINFSQFLVAQKLHDLRNATHNDIRKYIAFLRKHKRKEIFVQKSLSILNTFLEWGAWSYPTEFPPIPIIHMEDRPKIVRKEPKYYSENEIAQIKSVLPYADKMTARITLVMLHCGLRFQDAAKIQININGHNCLSDNGYPILEYYMPKVRRYNRIPIPTAIAKIIKSQMAESKQKYGETCVYLFAKNEKQHYNITLYRNHMNRLFIRHNLTANDGTPLRLYTRLFRKTYATNLINNSIDTDTIRAMLGHKNVYTQNHYATIHSKTMVELLAPLTKQDNDLIANIGHISTDMLYVPDDYSDFIPLPNGSCSCAGDCNHQNAC